VTFLFTDIEGSTRLWDEHPAEMTVALSRHDQIMREVLEAHGGYVFATGGDGFAVAFGRAGDAVVAAGDAQRRLLAEPWPDEAVVRVRMGLHSGEVTERDGDFFGPAVNVAARIAARSRGGHILASTLTAGLCRISGVEWVPVGRHRLRGVAEPVELAGLRGLGVEWGPDALMTPPMVAGNLPVLLDEFVGRHDDIKAVSQLLRTARLVSLTGAGGVGKTRLAVEAAWTMVDEFPGGVWLVELGSLADPAALGHFVASAVAVSPQGGEDPLDAIVDRLASKRALLLVDNCEHLLDSVAALLEALAARCPDLRVIATSREALGVRGERVHPTRSLTAAEGVELFCLRALALDDSRSFSDDDLVMITAICQRLDGIPLAIQLAASRSSVLSLPDLQERLQDRFRYLRGSGRGGIERHQTLRATVDWSYRPLTSLEQRIFTRLSVFAGSFDLAAAEAVAQLKPNDADLLEVLAGLVDKSMLTVDTSQTPTRYRLLETLRQYGEEHLEAAGETSMIRDRHLGYFCEYAERCGVDYVEATQVLAAKRFGVEWDNLRAAHQWALTTANVERAARIVVGARWYSINAARPEHATWNTATMAVLPDAHDLIVDVIAGEAWWASINERPADAFNLATRGIATDSGSPVGIALCLMAATQSAYFDRHTSDCVHYLHALTAFVGDDLQLINHAGLVSTLHAAFVAEDLQWAAQLASRHAAAAEMIGSPLWLAYASSSATAVALAAKDHQNVIAAATRALGFARQAGCGALEAAILSLLCPAVAAADERTFPILARQAITTTIANRYWHSLVWILEPLAHYWAHHDQRAEAAIVLGYRDTTTGPAIPELEPSLDDVRHDPRLAPASARGRQMTRDELLAFVLEHLGAP
jgi:predicted ATPase/class 3 adenylate cyclase